MTSADLLALVKKHPISFSCGLVSLILAGLIYYQSGMIEESQAAFDAKAAEAQKVSQNVRNAKDLVEQVSEMQALGKELESRLINGGQLAINQQYFYRLEAENDVKLVDVKQGAPSRAKTGLYVGIPYTVSVTGSFKQVLQFLQKLEHGPHFCRFSSILFNKSGNSGEAVGVGGPAGTAMNITITLELLGTP